MRHASSTSSRISSSSSASHAASTQLKRMSESRGSMNLWGSVSTSMWRSSFGKPKPITVSSREKATKTIWPTRNLMRSCTSTS